MKKILLIDDDIVFLKTVQVALVSKGYEVMQAHDGEEGFEMIKKDTPNLVLLDVMMPNLGGMDFLRMIKQDPALKNIPVIIVSNLGNAERVSEAMELGAFGYINKADESLQTIADSITSAIG